MVKHQQVGLNTSIIEHTNNIGVLLYYLFKEKVFLFPNVFVLNTIYLNIPLGMQGKLSSDELLQKSFADVGQYPQAFSSIKYVGTRTKKQTDFTVLFQTVTELANNTSVRSRRKLVVIYDVLNVSAIALYTKYIKNRYTICTCICWQV